MHLSCVCTHTYIHVATVHRDRKRPPTRTIRLGGGKAQRSIVVTVCTAAAQYPFCGAVNLLYCTVLIFSIKIYFHVDSCYLGAFHTRTCNV